MASVRIGAAHGWKAPLTFDPDTPFILPASVSPSALHGAVCGLLCGSAGLGEATLIRDLARLLRLPLDDQDEALHAYIQGCRSALAAEDIGFTPRLADDDESVVARLASLQQWCESFVDGFSLSTPDLDDAAEEALADITAVASLDAEAELEDDAEAELLEVEEHVKVAVLLLYLTVYGYGAADDQQ